MTSPIHVGKVHEMETMIAKKMNRETRRIGRSLGSIMKGEREVSGESHLTCVAPTIYFPGPGEYGALDEVRDQELQL